MFKKPIDETAEALKKMTLKLATDIENVSPDSPEAKLMVDNMKTLYELKETDANIHSKKLAARTALIAIGANLVGIGIIVGYEQAHVITSKALDRIQKNS